jgi:hypothetical protein
LSGVFNRVDDAAEQVGSQDTSMQVSFEDGDIKRKSPADFWQRFLTVFPVLHHFAL